MGANSSAFPPLECAGAGSKRILLLEDDPDIAQLVASILEMDDYQVEMAANGLEGLDALQRGLPDLVLLDMKMPVMDGREFAQEFRARHGYRVPIVIVTAGVEGWKEAEVVGAMAWISKPFNLKALAQTVARWSGARPADPHGGPPAAEGELPDGAQGSGAWCTGGGE